MKYQPWQSGILALSVSLALAGCGRDAGATSTNAPAGRAEKLKEQAGNAVRTTKDYLDEQKSRLQKGYSDKMSQFDKQMADLRAKSAAAGDKATSEWKRALSRLDRKKESAARKLQQFKNAGEDRWQEFKKQTESAFADLEKSFKDTFSRFANDDKSAKRSE